ncbi:hypothetical protein D4764_01G0016180 [Takifugu flavidus]|uniref:Uncharacterized protein n=1 Tax=Takifugu flavidus TaxID=433684 RepID=A0A5C6PQN4_9TELE|nr:hypothetical protein D4764_01G0016180 [Takifugu flavidus]
MKDGGDRKARQLEDAATATDNSDQEYMPDASELSNMVVDSERDDVNPPSMIKNFLTQTRGALIWRYTSPTSSCSSSQPAIGSNIELRRT